MPNQESTNVQETLQLIVRVDDKRTADDPFKLPKALRADVEADLEALADSDAATAPAEGDRAAASARRRRALGELDRQLRGGYRFLAGIDEDVIADDERRRAFEAYGWKGGKIGHVIDDDSGVLAQTRLALGITAKEVPNAAHRYPAARLKRLKDQLAIADADQAAATGSDRQAATDRRDVALETASTTALRVRFFYCSASRDADQTPELARVGYQPRRDPGQAGGQAATKAPAPVVPTPPPSGLGAA